MRNHSYENDFDLHENKTACRIHFHMKGFALRLVLKQRHERTRKWPISWSFPPSVHIVAWPARYTLDKSAEKMNGKVLVPSSHVKACDFLGFVEFFFFFLKSSTTIFPLHGPNNWVDRWRKLLRVRRRQNCPTRRSRWLGRNIFFCPISGTEFDHFWNWFGKNKFPGALQLLK